MRHIKNSLKKWNKEVLGNIQGAKRNLKVEMERVQGQINQGGLSPELQHLESTLTRELDERDQQEQIMFRQKSKMLWLKEGNKNTKFFHNSLLQHRNQNWIHSLKIEQRVTVRRNEDIEHSLKITSVTCSPSPLKTEGQPLT